MNYTKNQHLISRWILRNFRSDDTAKATRDKKRVWSHTIYLDPDKGNFVKDIPLPISSVGMKKDCFSLLDDISGRKFDIENELSTYELKISEFFNSLIHVHNFEQLLDIKKGNSALEKLLNFIIIQFVLNLQNPQNKFEFKDEILSHYTSSLIHDFDNIKNLIDNPPLNLKRLMEGEIYAKIRRAARSRSSVDEICKTLLILFMLAEDSYQPTLINFLPTLRNSLFKDIYIEGIYHSGYDFDSTSPRPVFTIGPNVMCIDKENNSLYLPLSHNFAIWFSIGTREFYNSSLNIFSPNPERLKCKTGKRINVFKVSHDHIDNMTSIINLHNISHSNTIYSPHCLKNVEDYLALQEENEDFYYTPQAPLLYG